MSGAEIGQALRAAWNEVPHNAKMCAGGNLGMAFIADAIRDHAAAVRRLAEAVESCGMPRIFTSVEPSVATPTTDSH